jgi:hypothetical protein
MQAAGLVRCNLSAQDSQAQSASSILVTRSTAKGLQLVAALSRCWGTRYLRDGKCIWTGQDIPYCAA